ncbi:MAG: hypothetical protein KGS60_08235 [Verrucomicrobia bacterium]|nr:hypothetical protein [Verrucomicrobiota bacterium]
MIEEIIDHSAHAAIERFLVSGSIRAEQAPVILLDYALVPRPSGRGGCRRGPRTWGSTTLLRGRITDPTYGTDRLQGDPTGTAALTSEVVGQPFSLQFIGNDLLLDLPEASLSTEAAGGGRGW